MAINIDNIIPIPRDISTHLPKWVALIGKLDDYYDILNREILPAIVSSNVQILNKDSIEYANKLGNIFPVISAVSPFSSCSRHKVVSALSVDNTPISFGFTNSLLNGNDCSTLAKIYEDLGVDGDFYRAQVHPHFRENERHAEQLAIAGAFEKIEFLLDDIDNHIKPIHIVLYSSHFTCKVCASRFVALMDQLRNTYQGRFEFSGELIFDQFWANEAGTIMETLDMYQKHRILVTLVK